jgi:hypothetical protein
MFASCLQIMSAHLQLMWVEGIRYWQLIRVENTAVCRSCDLCLQVVTVSRGIDLYSRQIVGWSMAERMKTKLVNDALIMAIWKRKPAKGLLWHTDRGSQYASDSHRKLLKQHGITQSMSRKGNCWDNAVSE